MEKQDCDGEKMDGLCVVEWSAEKNVMEIVSWEAGKELRSETNR